MDETNRITAREIARKHLELGDPLGWFEDLYSQASENTSIISWADMMPSPNVVDWLDRYPQAATGKAL